VEDNKYNMDESGFQVGCGKQSKVVTFATQKEVRISLPNNWELCTIIKCINALGWAFDPIDLKGRIVTTDQIVDLPDGYSTLVE